MRPPGGDRPGTPPGEATVVEGRGQAATSKTQAGGGHRVPRRAGLPSPRLRNTTFILKSAASVLKKSMALLRSKERPEKTSGEKSLEAVEMPGQKPQSKYKRTRGKCRSCNVHISRHLRKRKSNQGRRDDI